MKPLSSREKTVGLVLAVGLLMNVAPAQAVDGSASPGPKTAGQTDGLLDRIEQQAFLDEIEAQRIELEQKLERAREQQLRNQIVAEALTYVGQVRYVLTGSTPTGWDCSGFTRYVFGKFGHELEHSAGKQKRSGLVTGVPQPGDLVAFDRGRGTEHIGIYVGNGVLVEATVETGTTRVVDIDKAYPENRWKLTYVNVLSDGLLQ